MRPCLATAIDNRRGYHAERAASAILAVTGAGMDKLTRPVSRKELTRTREAPGIIEGATMRCGTPADSHNRLRRNVPIKLGRTVIARDPNRLEAVCRHCRSSVIFSSRGNIDPETRPA